MKTRAYNLMKEWCDTLLSHQVRTNTPYTDGGLLCPACHVIHGRIADLCFPLTVIWAHTGEEKYLEEADRLIDWSEYNLQTPDKLWYNDITNRWYATSAFSAMSIGEALYHFGDKIPERYREKWFAIFKRMCDVFTTLDTRESFKPVNNYYCGLAAVLAMAWRLTNDEKYLEKTKYWLDVALSRFDKEGLLYGEAHILECQDGSHTIDMGYNLEESIPLLLRYASLTGDRFEFFKDRLRDHLAFLLPDGGIDNSFGVRHNKWTYWGSRTSDGVVEGLALVLDDPVFADACERVLTLYEKCTHNGLLAMPMAHETGEPTCLHHTFTHAKALAALVCADVPSEIKRVKLPGEEKYGVKTYQNGRLITVSHGCFRATFSAAEGGSIQHHTANAGGSMNLLYHDRYGIVCAATTVQYIPTEPLNQQYLRNADNPDCMTAQFVVNGTMACTEKQVTLSACQTTVTAKSALWQADYCFEDSSLKIKLRCENGAYNLPIVCSKNQKAKLSEDKTSIVIDGVTVVKSDSPMICDTEVRVFHQVGGLSYLPISVKVRDAAIITLFG